MTRCKVEDPVGLRWKVRAGEVDVPDARPPRDAGEMHRLLAGALAPVPLEAGEPPRAWTADDDGIEARTAMRSAAASLSVDTATPLRSLVRVARALARLRTSAQADPSARHQAVVLEARGRIRRSATWLVEDPEEAAHLAASVAADVRAGRLPDPPGAMLVRVLDHRPAHLYPPPPTGAQSV